MKNIFYILVISIFSTSMLCGQSENTWPRPGAVWQYCSWDIKTFAYTRDTIFGEKLYSVVEWIGADESELAPGQTFYGYLDADEFTTLYRTSGDTIYRRVNDLDYVFMIEGIQEGESFNSFRSADISWNEFSCHEYMDLTVSNVEIINIGGNSYRQVTLVTEWPNGIQQEFPFIESIGLGYQFQYILDGMGSGVSADLWDCYNTIAEANFIGYLFHYQDNEIDPGISLSIIVTGGSIPSCFSSVESFRHNHPDMLLWPNPSREVVYVKIQDANSTLRKVELLDLVGNKIAPNIELSDIGTIDVRQLAQGIYFIVAEDTQGITYRKKLVVR